MRSFPTPVVWFFFGFFFLLPLFALGQGQPIPIDDTRNIEDIVKALQGKGAEITNVTYSIPGQGKPIGYFEDPAGLLGLKKGLLITTGAAQFAVGPNNTQGSSFQGAVLQMNDPDLATIASVPFLPFFDIAIIEFDIKTRYSNLSFGYVFGSEEYTEWENSFTDTFGLFISGPGINGVKNIATLNNGSPVSVNSINENINSENFILNGAGSALNQYLQYDGLTKKLVATARVTPNETYHIKIIIADAVDNNFDSGAFIEQDLTPYEIKISYEHPRFDYAIEGCNKAYLTIQRDDATDPLTLDVSLEGTADNGVDFTFVQPGPVTLAAGQLTSVIEIVPIADANLEGIETVTVNFNNAATGKLIIVEVPIRDVMTYNITESKICAKVPTLINTNPEADFSFNWQPRNELSCQQCTSPTATLTQNALFQVEVTHQPSGCRTNTTASVLVNNQYQFTDETICYNTSSVINKNASNDFIYRWADNQGLSCLNCPTPLITSLQNVKLSVEVEEVASGCKTSSELALNVFRFDFSFPETFACENKATTINNNPPSGYTFEWQPDPSLSCTACTSPAVMLDHDAHLQVKVKEQANGCEISKEVPVEVVRSYTVPDSFVCKGDETAINVHASDNYKYQWNANQAISCTDCKSPKVTLDKDTSFPLAIEEIRSGCKTLTQALVRVKSVDYLIAPLTVCANEPTVINSNAPAQYVFQWETGADLSCFDCPSPSLTTETDLQLKVSVQDNRIGCRTTLTVPVKAKKVTANFTYTITDQYSSIAVDFKNQSSGANEYRWSFGDGSTSSDFETTHQYEPQGKDITVQLTTFNNQGLYCEATSSATIFIHEPIFIPNVFTPDGDEYNQFFEIKGIQKGLWTLTIINNWGDTVYSSGSYQNEWQAEKVLSGVYYYELRNPQDSKSYKGWLHVIK
ncbi:hypothetical protein WSM22_37990 [Cytophagales bacterium WSM2-2]|nr:hypothetical protein WSM22_37990 [Cytophagales bacterium WSM2-2]